MSEDVDELVGAEEKNEEQREEVKKRLLDASRYTEVCYCCFCFGGF